MGGMPVIAKADPLAACTGDDIIVITTSAETPILAAEWIAPGRHVSTIESDAEHKDEVDPGLFGRTIYVADNLKPTRRLGESLNAFAAGAVSAEAGFAEFGQVFACIFDKGHIYEGGPPNRLFTDPKQERTREFIGSVVRT